MYNVRIWMSMLVVALAMIAPAVGANHGELATYQSNDGTVKIVGKYQSGNGNTQTWVFAGTSGACTALGSIEAGWVGTCITATGTNHFHAYSPPDPDLHPVTVNGLPGTVEVIV